MADGILDLGVARRPNWTYVPMPPSIEALPRSAGGLPVPWVAQWEGEEQMVVAPCKWVDGRPAVFPADGSKVGVTRPIFGVMEPSRQREASRGVRCQVCHAQLSEMSDVVVPGREPLWLVDLLHEPSTMRDHRLSLEPWVCDDCLAYALQVCPGLLLATTPTESASVPRSWRIRNVLAVWAANPVAAVVQPHGSLEGQPPCIGYVKIEPLIFRRLSSFHLLERGPAEIRRLLVAEGPPS